MTLLESLQVQLGNSLQRRSSSVASRWAENYVVLGKPIPGPMRFTRHPWGRVWCDLQEDWVGKKGAQMMMTLACLVRAIFTVDILRNDALYVLPKKNPDAADFSKAKFDTMLELSPYLRNLFNNVRNIGHKQAGAVNFYLRGSRSRSGLKSISVGLKIFDEFDEMNQANVPLAEERSAGYQEKDCQTIKISTPTLPDFGITKEYLLTTQEHYFFGCPFCSTNGRPTHTEFLSRDQLIIPTDNAEDKQALGRSYYITGCCRHPLPPEMPKTAYLNEQNAGWHATQSEHGKAELRGFWIPQFYSMVKPTWRIAQQIVRARTDEVENQEVHNSVEALEFVAEGARVMPEMVQNCIGRPAHANRTLPQSPIVTMGVDVGHKELFCTIDEWLLPRQVGAHLNSAAIPRTRALVIVPNFADLDQLMYDYQIKHAIVDVDPAQREAIDFCNRFGGHANLCRFVRNIKQRDVVQETDLVVQVNRTIWLDQSQNRYRHARIILPHDLPLNYAKMLGAIIKITEKDKDQNLISRYKSIGADHWAFSRCYSEIALPHAISVAESQPIQNFL